MVHWNKEIDHGIEIKHISEITEEKKSKENGKEIKRNKPNPTSTLPSPPTLTNKPNLHACRYPRVGFPQTNYQWQTFCQNLLRWSGSLGLPAPDLVHSGFGRDSECEMVEMK